MEAAAPLQHIPGEHNGNAILRLVKQEPHMISLKAWGHSCRSERDAPRTPFSTRRGTGRARSPPGHPCPGGDRTAATHCPLWRAGPAGRGKVMPCHPPCGQNTPRVTPNPTKTPSYGSPTALLSIPLPPSSRAPK